METIEKPWGKEELLEVNEHYMVKRLTMWEGARCSLQYHRKKRETIFVLSGKLRLVFGATKDYLESRVCGPGESMTIPPGLVHRMEAVESSIYLEASTPELDDVVRLSDDYNRAIE